MNISNEPTELKVSFDTEKVYPALEDLTVTPTIKEQHFKSEKYGYNEVTVEPIESESLDVTPTMNVQRYEGLFDVVTVDAIETEELNITPSEEEQVKEGLFDKVSVGAIPTEEKVATLDFSNTDIVEVTPREGSYLKKVSINKDANKVPSNIAKDVVIDGVKGTFTGTYNALLKNPSSTSFTLNTWITELSELDLSGVTNLQNAFNGMSNLTRIPIKNIGSVTNYNSFCKNSSKLTSVISDQPLNGTNYNQAFQNCSALVEIPNISGAKITNNSNYNGFYQMFSGCNNLNDESLEKILDMCISATQVTANKTLNFMSLPTTLRNRCTTLSNYQAFLNAGWTLA